MIILLLIGTHFLSKYNRVYEIHHQSQDHNGFFGGFCDNCRIPTVLNFVNADVEFLSQCNFPCNQKCDCLE